MLVLVLIEEARKPKYYRWMWGDTLEPRAEEASIPQAPPSATHSETPSSSRSAPPAETPAYPTDTEAALPVGAVDTWSYAVDQLTEAEATGLYRLLRSVRNSSPHLKAESSPELAGIDRLQTAWQTYLEHARAAISESPPINELPDDSPDELPDDSPTFSSSPLSSQSSSQSPSPRELWEKLARYWEEVGEPALEHLRAYVQQPVETSETRDIEATRDADATQNTDATRDTDASIESDEPMEINERLEAEPSVATDESLEIEKKLWSGIGPLQQAMDRRALAQVRDNAPFIPAEQEAWFRLIERLRAGDVTPVSAGQERVTYLQLLDQPEIYRGKFVRIRGDVRKGYRVDAPENDSGVAHYHVLWLKPDDGTNAPIVLYVLGLPPGFPPLADRTATGGVTDLTETVDVGGAFFKRWAYRGARNLEIAPQLIVSEMTWYPEESDFQAPIARGDIVTAILGGLLLGFAGLWFAWRTLHLASNSTTSSSTTSSSPASSKRSSGDPSLQSRSARPPDPPPPGSGAPPSTPMVWWALALGGIWGLAAATPAVAFAMPSTMSSATTSDEVPGSPPWTRPDRPSGPSELPDILQLFGIISSDLETLVSPETSSSERERLLLNLLFYLPRLGPEDWSRWRETELSLENLLSEPSLHRGQSIVLRGRAQKIQAHAVPVNLAETLEFSHYWEVTVQLTDDQQEVWGEATVFSRQIPAAWQKFEEGELDELTEIRGAFLNASGNTEGNTEGDAKGGRKILAATARLPWFPDRLPDPSHPVAGLVHPVSVQLSGAGVDHALWDEVRRRNNRPLDGPDRELFYQILAAVTQRDSVAMGQRHGQGLELGPLLLSPTDYQGELLTLTAFARRITRVTVADRDIRQRFGITHYFHIDALIDLGNQQIRLESRTPGQAAVYTDKFPMTFCTVQLPADLLELVEPDTGGSSPRPLINERIHISGIFLKTWPFRSEFLLGIDPEQRHPSPLLLGTRPVTVPMTPLPRDTPLELMFAILFVILLTGGAVWVWRKDRSPKGT
jgi:hypothetical protein